MKLNKSDFLPIFVLGGFNFLTLMLYLISPFNYVYGDFTLSVIYVFINIIFLFFGYVLAQILFQAKSYKKYYLYNFGSELEIFKILLTFFSATFLIRYAYLLHYQFYDISGMLGDIFVGILDPKVGYLSTVNNTRPFTVPWSVYAFVTIFHSLFFITGALVWKKLNSLYKILFLFFVFIEMIYWYSRGTNFGIISLIIVFFLAYLLNVKKINFKFIFNILIIAFIILVVFSVIMSVRMEGVVDLSSYEIYLTTINYNSVFLNLCPDYLKPSVLSIFSYLTQGYYFLSFGFEQSFSFTYFLGSNVSLISIASLIGIDIEKSTYVFKLSEYGIDPTVQWHSAYLWLASDLTFYFVPFYIFLLGFGLSFSWIMATRSDDYLFKVLFIILGGYILFLFANTNFIASYFYIFIFAIFLILLKFILMSWKR